MTRITKRQSPNHMMNQNDIEYIANLLNNAIRNRDWEVITEVQEYIQEFQESPVFEEE
jgi:sulfur relay (sulfurtransferase) DsrC/TusE family protein